MLLLMLLLILLLKLLLTVILIQLLILVLSLILLLNDLMTNKVIVICWNDRIVPHVLGRVRPSNYVAYNFKITRANHSVRWNFAQWMIVTWWSIKMRGLALHNSKIWARLNDPGSTQPLNALKFWQGLSRFVHEPRPQNGSWATSQIYCVVSASRSVIFYSSVEEWSSVLVSPTKRVCAKNLNGAIFLKNSARKL